MLFFIIWKGVDNGLETTRTSVYVYVKPISFKVGYTSSRSTVFTFKYKEKIHDTRIAFDDYKKIKHFKKVKMAYSAKMGTFDLNSSPDLNADYGLFEFLLIFLPTIGVFYNIYVLTR